MGYPLGSSVSTRTMQAISGMTLGCSFQSLRMKDVLRLCMTGSDGLPAADSLDAMQLAQRRTAYSQVNTQVNRSSVNVSDSLTMLSFAEVPDNADSNQLSKADWTYYVNLDQISSVV